jgi:hypothetical protein
MPKKMTAIEYVQRVIYIHLTHEEQMQFEGLFQQAKAMEKEQIIETYNEGALDGLQLGEQYYNFVYK